MASSLTEHRFISFDGVEIAWTEMGEGRPVLLLHGLFSSAHTNWIRFGHAERVAGRGFRVIMPDLRAHGRSGKPKDPAAYPPDVLAKDGLALVDHLGLTDYNLGGYSLGGRTSLRMVVLGARPSRLIIGGMGLQGLLDTGRRAQMFKRVLTNLGEHQRGSPEWFAEAFMKTNKGDPEALLLLLDSFVDSTEEEICSITIPTLVLAGVNDDDNGPTRSLADLLPNAVHVETPGDHMSAVTKREFGIAIADFLSR